MHNPYTYHKIRNTTIRIKYSTRMDLEKIGWKGETYDLLINRLIEQYKMKSDNYFHVVKKIQKEFFVKCQKCRKFRALEIHHMDSNPENNVLDNLSLLCPRCHQTEHYLDRKNR